jgi:hypothetical protein
VIITGTVYVVIDDKTDDKTAMAMEMEMATSMTTVKQKNNILHIIQKQIIHKFILLYYSTVVLLLLYTNLFLLYIDIYRYIYIRYD